MIVLLLALGAFWVIRVLKSFLTVPAWAWHLFRLGISVGGVIVAIDKGHWYYSFSVAGASALLEMVDDLIMVKSDETLSRISRRR